MKILPAILAAASLAWPWRGLAQSPGGQCLDAARLAEQRWHLPQGVLAAIGQVESGRADAATGAAAPWPWTANVAGRDYVFGSATEAVNVSAFFLARGVSSIDVGCFQVNLRQHPEAFGTLGEAFAPAANADYAAHFLRTLYERAGSWVWAIGAYHSADPAEGAPYRDRVVRAWLAGRAAVAIPVYTPATLPSGLRRVVWPLLERPRPRPGSQW